MSTHWPNRGRQERRQGHQVEKQKYSRDCSWEIHHPPENPKQNQKDGGTEYRHAGNVRLREQAGARVRTAPKALSSHLDFVLQGLVGRFWKAVTL